MWRRRLLRVYKSGERTKTEQESIFFVCLQLSGVCNLSECNKSKGIKIKLINFDFIHKPSENIFGFENLVENKPTNKVRFVWLKNIHCKSISTQILIPIPCLECADDVKKVCFNNGVQSYSFAVERNHFDWTMQVLND